MHFVVTNVNSLTIFAMAMKQFSQWPWMSIDYNGKQLTNNNINDDPLERSVTGLRRTGYEVTSTLKETGRRKIVQRWSDNWQCNCLLTEQLARSVLTS